MLRKHQKVGHEAAIKHYRKNKHFRFNMTTGTGKTVLAIHTGDALYKKDKVVATHTNILKEQFRKEVDKWAKDPSTWVVETYQTLRGMRIPCNMLIVDEVHQGGQESEGSYKTIIKGLAPLKILSLSATDYKVDEKLFGKEKFSFGLEEASKAGGINESKIIILDTGLKQILSSGDKIIADKLAHVYDQDVELGVDLKHSKTIETVLENNIKCALKEYKKSEKSQAIMFVNSIEWCDKARLTALQMKIDAKNIHSGMKKEEVADIVNSFKNKDFKLLICVRQLAEGFDYPELEVVIDCCPSFTNEGRMFKQRFGRPLRKLEGKPASRYYIVNTVNKFSSDLDVYDSLMANIEVVSRNDLRENKYTNREINIPIGVQKGNTRTYTMFVEHTEGYVAGEGRSLFELIGKRDSISDKKELLDMALNGHPKPDKRRNHKEYTRLYRYTSEDSIYFDLDFREKIVSTGCGWLNKMMDKSTTKERLLLLIKRGIKHRTEITKSGMGTSFINYIDNDHEYYDPKFVEEIKKIAPKLLIARGEISEKRFLGIIEQLIKKETISRKDQLFFNDKINPKRKGKGYESKFIEILKKEYPNYFEEVRIKANLNMAIKRRLKKPLLGIRKNKNGTFSPCINVNDKNIVLGNFPSIEEALKVRLEAELNHWS